MLKLEQSQESLVGKIASGMIAEDDNDALKGVKPISLENPLDGFQLTQSTQVETQDGQQPDCFVGGDYFEAGNGAGSLESTDFLSQDYYYYAGGPAGQHVMDTAFYNWQMPQMAGNGVGASCPHQQQQQQQMGEIYVHAGPQTYDLMQGSAAVNGLISEYEYGMYAAAAAVAVSNQHGHHHHHQSHHVFANSQGCTDGIELGVPVRMPDAMLYPALDEPTNAALTAEAALLNAEQQAGIFNDYFNLNTQGNGAHPYYYSSGHGDEVGVMTHVKPSDVISPELFQAMHIPLVGLYGGYQPGLHHHHAEKPILPATGSKKSSASSASGSARTKTSKSKKKTPGMACPPSYAQSFFSTKDSSSLSTGCDTTVEMSGSLQQTTTNGVPTVIGEDGKVYTKPPYSYAALISRALRECEGAKLTLAGIYDWIKSNFPYYRSAEAAWQVITHQFESF